VPALVQRYLPEHKAAWDEFVHDAKNATFLFYRDYMGYHDDRFSDHSLMIERDGALVALLPANAVAQVLESHGGLTYGGLIVGDHMTTAMMMEVFGAVVDHAADAGFSALLYKTVPAIYHRRPAEEDRYALFRAGAELVRREVLSVLEPAAGSPSQQRRRRAIAKATKAGLVIIEDAEFAAFWPILETLLDQRHGTTPVHALDEIEFLHSRFPEHIRLFTTRDGAGNIQAGALIYESPRVAHVQYMATTEYGRDCGALDLCLAHLIGDVFADKPWIDLGISNEMEGRFLNEGLIGFKEGFGARALVHDFYSLEISAA
jgi:hypothetical protein